MSGLNVPTNLSYSQDARKKMIRNISQVVIIVFVTLLTACGTLTRVSEPPISYAPGFKFKSASVVWIDNPNLRFQIFAFKYAYEGRGISEREKAYATQEAKPFYAHFRTRMAEVLAEKLAEKGVLRGDQVIIKLTPVELTQNVGDRRSLGIKVSIEDSKLGRLLWTTTIVAIGDPTPREGLPFTRPTNTNEEILAAAVKRVIEELVRGGWVDA